MLVLVTNLAKLFLLLTQNDELFAISYNSLLTFITLQHKQEILLDNNTKIFDLDNE